MISHQVPYTKQSYIAHSLYSRIILIHHIQLQSHTYTYTKYTKTVKIIYLTTEFKTKIPLVKVKNHVFMINCRNFSSIWWLTKWESSFYLEDSNKINRGHLMLYPWNRLTSCTQRSKSGVRWHQVSRHVKVSQPGSHGLAHHEPGSKWVNPTRLTFWW